MDELLSRTPMEIINCVAEQLKLFSLAELFYILRQDTEITHLDRLRCKKIAESLRRAYGGNQSDTEVETVISSLSDAFRQDVKLYKKSSLMSMAGRRLSEHMVVPFTAVCPICEELLSRDEANQRLVKVYGSNGSVVAG
jgi:hypothetical protein